MTTGALLKSAAATQHIAEGRGHFQSNPTPAAGLASGGALVIMSLWLLFLLNLYFINLTLQQQQEERTEKREEKEKRAVSQTL